MTDLSKL